MIAVAPDGVVYVTTTCHGSKPSSLTIDMG